MQKKLLKFLKSKIFFYIIYFSLMFLLHSKINFSNDDTNYFSIQLDSISWFDFIKMRYQMWSSRIVIESVLIYLSRFVILWRILNSLVICLLIYTIDKLIFQKTKVSNLIFIGLIFLVYPYIDMSEAGFCSTTLNYLWPLTFLLFSLIPLRYMQREEKIRKSLIPFYLLAFVYACNQEQAVCIGMIVSLITFIFSPKNKQLRKYSFIMLLISIVSLCFILLCSGNDIRVSTETNIWYPDYVNADLMDKLYLGIVSTWSLLISKLLVLWLFSFCLVFLVTKTLKKVFVNILAILQFIIISILALFRIYVTLKNYNYGIFSYYTDVGNVFNFELKEIFILIACIGMILLFCYLLYSLLKKQSLIPIIVLLIGCMTRLLMGFSPTIFASGSRTMIFMFFSILLIVIYLYNHYRAILSNKEIKIFYGVVILLIITNFVFIYNTNI